MGKTRGVHETTPEIRNRMVGMFEAGLGLREIAVAVNCSQRTVKRWLNRFNREGSVETRDRCGRKRATTQEEDDAIARLATQTPITAAKAVLPALGLHCSVDTVRERLHKAGIHNWRIPSKKHIQKIPIDISDESGIQQAVWRTTGTQVGKKKLAKPGPSTNDSAQPKKKASSPRVKSKQPREQESLPYQPPVSGAQELEQRASDVQLLASPLLPQTTMSLDPSHQFNHSLNPLPQPLYQHHPGLNMTQVWPLDLVHSAHHYPQHPVHLHEHHSAMHLQSHLHDGTNEVQQHSRAVSETPMQSTIVPLQNFDQHKVASHQGVPEPPREKMIAGCSESRSNSSSICSNENSQSSNASNSETNNGDCDDSSKGKNAKSMENEQKKKGGKVKGTLETSVEIRNRMIGMAEAGLSTLSIALAINRSERTVKRWLDRWHREGNVQTKERKGRRRITTKEQDDAIVAMASQQPLTAAKHVVPALGLKCSVDTIRERLHRAGFHSWKLGKKQGKGNVVHNVHLWQPSGNRSNRNKASGNKRKKSVKKRSTGVDSNKQINKKQTEEVPPVKVVLPAANVVPEKIDSQFQNQSQSPPVTQTTQDLSSVAGLMQPQIPSACSANSIPSQSLHLLGPVMPQRPDCRLAFSAIVPTIPGQFTSSIPLSSCMMAGTSHPIHVEQSDPMNYEPYIWSF
ncbi:uncharacterized protein LOC106638187 [Copidosoma floridanum]|uniref:uncharacterized protein LOC106638187 n=1 Tax=Copidosoma floridanum TaxID=29053 RepID=UPI0006C95D33|nr:uncharacterized protein LOC106638187 [Copidosoma floridanum]